MEKSVFHCSPSEWKWTSLKLPSPGTYLKTMQRVDPWYQFKTRSQKCRWFVGYSKLFILDWHFEILAPILGRRSRLSVSTVLLENSDITSHQFFSISVPKTFFSAFLYSFISLGLDHALGRYQKIFCRPKNLSRYNIFVCFRCFKKCV